MRKTLRHPFIALQAAFIESFGRQIRGNFMTIWLHCRLDDGMFSDEVAVTYPDSDKWQKSVFVSRHFVEPTNGHTGKVRVNLVVKDGVRYAVLPSSQRDIVRVNEADLERQ